MKDTTINKNCINRIRHIIETSEEVSINSLCLYALENYGKGPLFVKRYLQLLEDGGYIKTDKALGTVKKKKKKRVLPENGENKPQP